MTQNSNGRSMTTRHGEVLPPERTGSVLRNDFSWVDTRWRANSRAVRLANTIEGLTRGLDICRNYNDAADRYEQSRQRLALTRAKAELIPMHLQRGLETSRASGWLDSGPS